jgi:O-antigen/teichoic acid export membrane protein
MGPNDYGRYALITSLYLWFMMLSDLGFAQIMGRYTPLFILQGEKEKLQKFFTNLLAVSLINGVLSGCLYLWLTTFWLNDLDLFLLIMMAAAIVVRASTHPFFTLFLGLNQAARWGMGEIFRHGLTIVTVIVGFYLSGLQGACLGLFLTELVVLSIGIGWGKSYFSWKDLRLDLRYLIPYLRFGFMFFVFNLLATAFQHSGEILIRFFYPDYAQVAYFGLAYHVFHTVSVFIPQLTIAFAPFMVTLLAQGETKILKQWIEQLIKWLTVGGVIVFFSVLLLGNDLVLLVLGAAYQPVAINLLPLSLMLCVQVLSNVGILLTIVYNRPKIAVMAAGIRLVAMLIFGPFLIARWGSWGGCLAVLAASVIFAGYLTWYMKRGINYSLKKWIWVIVLGLLYLPLLWWQSSWMMNCALYSIFVVGYVSLLLFLRIITLGELKTVWRGIDPRRRISDLKLQGR